MPAAGLILLLASAPARANTFVVTTAADGNNGACTVSLCTLRDAVIAANANAGADVITLPSNASPYALTIVGANEDNAATGDLDIKGDLTISGGGAASTIIDGGGLDRIFQILGSAVVTINGITVRNGNVDGGGGGILSDGGGSLTLNDCVVTSNKSGPPGGGISATALVLNRTIVSGNECRGSVGGGVFLINGSSSVVNSTVTGNISVQASGGGISVGGGFHVPTTVSIVNSTISSNIAGSGSEAGGIYVDLNSGVTITGSTISGNMSTADSPGGGIYNLGNLQITDCTISGNGSNFGNGAGILNLGTLTINASTIRANTTLGKGGGIANSSSLFITNCTISGNTASSGGGLYNFATGTAIVTSATIAGNAAGAGNGGGIHSPGSATLKNTIVADNSGGNCAQAVTDGGTNLQFPQTTCGAGIPSADPLLQPLADNGGPTLTQALGANSPALDTAGGCPPPNADQRGISRAQGPACEIGSFECRAGDCVVVVPTATPTATPTPTDTPTPTNTPTPTDTPTPTQTPTPVGGAVVPTLSFPMLALLCLALAAAALMLLKK